MEGRNDRTMNDRYSSTQKQESCVQHAINIFGFFFFFFFSLHGIARGFQMGIVDTIIHTRGRELEFFS